MRSGLLKMKKVRHSRIFKQSGENIWNLVNV